MLGDQSSNTYPTAIVSLEHLYHYQCGSCRGWWSIADKHHTEGELMVCPNCAKTNTIGKVQIPSPMPGVVYAN
jgi:predicted SprT family Zn-dependent metalloprotease